MLQDTLIITLVNHPKFGHMLQPAFASYRQVSDRYAITEKATARSSSFPSLSSDEQAIIKLSECCTDKYLMRFFSKEKREADFLQKVTDHHIELYIRPFIEKKQGALLELIRRTKTPIFLREKVDVRDFRREKAIAVLDEPSSMVFIFSNKDTFTYCVKVYNGATEVELYGQFFAPLVSSPAVVVIGSTLHHFTDVDQKKLRPFIRKKQIEVPGKNLEAYIRGFVMQCVKKYDTIGEGLIIFEQKYLPVAVLTLETGFDLQPVLNLRFRYGKFSFSMDSPYKKEVELMENQESISIGWFYRDERWEKGHIRMLTENGLQITRTGQFSVAPASKKVREEGQCNDERINCERNKEGLFSCVGNNDERSKEGQNSGGGNDDERSNDGFVGENCGTESLGVVEWMNRNGEILRNFTCAQAPDSIQYYTGEIELKLSPTDKNDWFEIECMVCFGETAIPFAQFKNHILNQIREYILPDGRIAVLPNEWFSRFGEMFRYGKTEGSHIRLEKHHFRIKELAEKGFLPEVQHDGEVSQMEIPTALNATLRPYQLYGFRWLGWLHQNGFGGCLADDMGLGKTLQTISILLYVYAEDSKREVPGRKDSEQADFGRKDSDRKDLRHSDSRQKDLGRKDSWQGVPIQLSLFDEWEANDVSNLATSPIQEQRAHSEGSDNDACDRTTFPPAERKLPPSLIAMPTSLIHNWLNELKKFAPSLQVYVHTGPSRLHGAAFAAKMQTVQVVLTSYGIVRQDIEMLSAEYFHYIILDESQYIKNPTSQIFSCVKQLRASFRIVLTGTPIENRLSDLWAQMDFLNEGILGNHNQFKVRFPEREVMKDQGEREMLLKIIEPFILRRTKGEVAPELPPLTDEVIYCEMDETHSAIYNEEKNKVRNELLEQTVRGGGAYAAVALSALTRLRLLANHPSMSIPDYQGTSIKFEMIVDLAEILFAENHKVLIFSSFVKHLKLFADYFSSRDWQYAWLTGSTIDREAEIERFNSKEDVRAFFISLKAGGTGLNLTAADYVFIIDPWWNPAAEMQAVSRAHRIGQTKKVTLYRFITQGTIEEKVQRLQQYKTALSDNLILPHLSVEEMEELLDVR